MTLLWRRVSVSVPSKSCIPELPAIPLSPRVDLLDSQWAASLYNPTTCLSDDCQLKGSAPNCWRRWYCLASNSHYSIVDSEGLTAEFATLQLPYQTCIARDALVVIFLWHLIWERSDYSIYGIAWVYSYDVRLMPSMAVWFLIPVFDLVRWLQSPIPEVRWFVRVLSVTKGPSSSDLGIGSGIRPPWNFRQVQYELPTFQPARHTWTN